jgi:uncharacterized protein YciI
MRTLVLGVLALGLALSTTAQTPAASPSSSSSPPASQWRPGEPPAEMTTYYLVMLIKGAKWTAESTPALEQLQKDHLAHLRNMALSGRLVLAGPLTDGGTIRGLAVYKAGSLEETRTLAENDPAVKAGRLAVEVHPWMVQKGILP